MSSTGSAEVVFDALGDPMRRRIVEALRERPLPVGELADRLPVGRPGVSKHLRVLQSAGLVEHHSVGTRNLYALAPGGLDLAQRWLVDMWDTALGEFAAETKRVIAERESGHRVENESGHQEET